MYYRTFFTAALLSLVSLTGCGGALELDTSSSATASTADSSAQIVFSRRMEGMNADLFVMDDTGNNLRQITDTPLMELDPTWSPDGSRLAFSYLNSGETGLGGFVGQVFSMRADGSDRVGYTQADGKTAAQGSIPTWSPDGSLSYMYIGTIWSIDPATSAIRQLTPEQSGPGQAPNPNIITEYDGWLDWSPDGQSFVTSSGSNIVHVKADGTLIKQLTAQSIDRDPVWSPDGTQIAFVRDDQSQVGDDGVSWPNDVFVINADGSNLRRITTTRGIDHSPVWSPDGKRIVFSSEGTPQPNGEPQPFNPNDIFVINVDGSGLVNLTNSPEHEVAPDWKP